MPTKRELAQAQGAVAERTAADLRALGDGARTVGDTAAALRLQAGTAIVLDLVVRHRDAVELAVEPDRAGL